jgi:uncharacterized phiE125 gp8 family phage protein
MALSLVTAVTTEPLTLDQARAQCRVTVVDDDDFIAGALIPAARQWGEAFTHRWWAPQTWDLKLDRFPCWAIEVPNPPATAIESVSYVDVNGVTRTLALTTDYVTDLPAGPMAMPARVMPAYSVPWPSTRGVANAVIVRVTGGYTSSGINQTPEAVKQAMSLLVAHWYANREAVGSVGGPIALAVESLLWPYKVF